MMAAGRWRGLLALTAGLGIGVALTAWARSRRGRPANARVPEPLKPVDLQRYLGKWYELGRLENRFERGCDRVLAQYSLLPDGLIQVLNTCGYDPARRGPRAATGRARVVPGSQSSKLKVSFFGPFFVGDYWILDHADDYSWSIVGEPSGRYLWILARDPMPPEGQYEKLVERAARMGYDMSRFRRTDQAAPPTV